MSTDTTKNLLGTEDNCISIEVHPEYAKMLPRWTKITDSLEDEAQIKEKGTEYLPMPSGLLSMEKTTRDAIYTAYVKRAIWYSYPRTSIGALIGLITKKPTNFELPDALQSIEDNASIDSDSLEVVKNRVLENQLSYSRYGILLDIPEGSEGVDVVPQMLEYNALSILNWVTETIKGKKTLIALVLNESGEEIKEGFTREDITRFRVCGLANRDSNKPVYYTYTTDEEGMKLFDIDQDPPDDASIPSIRNNTLEFIPFQIFNAISLEMETDIPVLMQLVDISFAIYRGEADYRHTLFMQGQGTPYAIGVESGSDTIQIGAGALIEISNPDAKVGFLEITGAGVDAQEKALTNLHSLAKEQGVSLQEAGASQSGEALGIRVGVKTASLTGIVRVNAKGFGNLLKWAADWMGINSEEVTVVPNVDFAQSTKTTKELTDMIAGAEKGLVRMEDLYNFQVKNDFTNATDFEEWKDELLNSGFTALLSGMPQETGE